jgi:hypothetical protein
MNGLGTVLLRRGDDALDVEITLSGGCGADVRRLVREPDMQCGAVRR